MKDKEIIIDLDEIKKLLEIETKKFGTILFESISLNNMIWLFEEIKKAKKTKREIVIELFYKMIAKPKIKLKDFLNIENTDIKKIVLKYIKSERYLDGFFKAEGDFIDNFIIAMEKYRNYQIGEIEQSLENLRSNILSNIINPFQKIEFGILSIFEDYFKDTQDAILRIATDFKEIADNYSNAEKKTVKILIKYNWFISPSLPISFIWGINKIVNDKKHVEETIKNLFYSYFSNNKWENLTLMSDRWKRNNFFKKRTKIIEDIVNLIKFEGLKGINIINAVLPTLISQIEGILTDYLISKGLKVDASYRRKKIHYQENKIESLPEKLNFVASKVLLDRLFQKSDPGKKLKIPFYFNRHKILHGEFVDYGREDYLIRALLILDLLSYLKKK